MFVNTWKALSYTHALGLGSGNTELSEAESLPVSSSESHEPHDQSGGRPQRLHNLPKVIHLIKNRNHGQCLSLLCC